jgi:biopolymer transport protein TolR
MPSQIHKRGPATPQMNMTPLIDVVFQIIIFFMLINNIIAEQTVQMYVPELMDPQTRPIEEQKRIVVNVAPIEYVQPGEFSLKDRKDEPLEGPQRHEAGALKVGTRDFRLKGANAMSLQDALRGVVSELEISLADNPDVEVELRADCALYYEQVEAVMGAISQAGVKIIHLVAYLPEEQRRRSDDG